MRNYVRAVLALAWKDWLRFSRQPFLVVASVLMPLIFVLFYSMIVPSSSTNPVVVALESDAPSAQQFAQTLREIHSQEAPYFEVITTDPDEARDMFESGQALGLIVIPADFQSRLSASSAQVELHLRNINSDYSKNLRLRLDYAIRQFSEKQNCPAVVVDETTWLPHDPPMKDYISTSLLLFAVLYSTMVNTGLQVASEWNDRTVKTLLLAPIRKSALVAGKVVAGLGQSLLSILLVALVLALVFHFNPAGSLWEMIGIVIVVMLLGAALGAVAGVVTKKTLPTTSILIVSAIAIFLLSGSEDSIRGLAWSGPIVIMWQLSRFLPTTYAFLAARSLFLTGETLTLGRDLVIVLVVTAVVMGIAVLLLRRAYSQLPGGQ